MRLEKLTSLAAALLSFAAISGLGGCSDSEGPTSPTLTPSTTTAPSSLADLSDAVVASMGRAIQDEYHAEAIYDRVLADFGSVRPFFNVVSAEERHSTSIARVYQNRDSSVPASRWNIDNVPRFESVQGACAGAVQAEIENIELYDGFLDMDLPDDLERVFQSNRRASLENHLPAFQNCAGN